MYTLGYDLGSSFVKASLLDLSTGRSLASAVSPDLEMEIRAPQSSWAEQDPAIWWEHIKKATTRLFREGRYRPSLVRAVGISYQMHGLILVDKHQRVLRPAIIWCDSRAVETGEKAFHDMGREKCLKHLLNAPGNFTASRLAWVKEHEPEIFSRIDQILLPGDYVAMKLTGHTSTTPAALSEGIFWDFRNGRKADFLLDYFDFPDALFPPAVPNFSGELKISGEGSRELGLPEGIPVSYRAGDQPNNAFSLKALHPGEVAATAGTSGVVYGVSESLRYDPHSRVNTFLHVNHTAENPRLGVLLCINGTGSLYAWLKRNVTASMDYPRMNELAAQVPVGSQGLHVLPFGNGAERLLENANPGSSVHHLNFNLHDHRHLLRASQEGIVFTFHYGLEIMRDMDIHPGVIRASHANMFLSPLFREALSTLTGATIELYDTDGAQGAARGAAVGAGLFDHWDQAFHGLQRITSIEPDIQKLERYRQAYGAWRETLMKML